MSTAMLPRAYEEVIPQSRMDGAMAFSDKLAQHRKGLGLTQQHLANQINLSVLQIRRYEAGKAQPTLDVIRRLALALGVTADALIFDATDRQPEEDLVLEFEAIKRFSDEEKRMVKGVLKGLILRHEAERF